MTVSSIGAGTSTLSLVDLLQDTQKESSSLLDSSTTLASSEALLSSLQNKRAQSAYYGGSASSAIGQAALKKALSEINPDGGRVTFKDIAEYREQLEMQFSAELRVALEQEGVDMDTEFTLNIGTDGAISVSCDDALAKQTIEQYLADNPEVCEQFGYIQALSNLERARQSPAGISAAWQEVRNSMQSFQAQAVEMFFSDALQNGMAYSSLLATFNAVEDSDASSSTSFYTGLNFTV